MEQLMLANINAGDNEMRDLAERRAVAARDWLVGQGGVAGDRVFVLEPKVEAEADGKKSVNHAEFSLR
jgi:outer membrane protein OmpA-like peptidoglycan-associated protein